jgi:hypothetical protein
MRPGRASRVATFNAIGTHKQRSTLKRAVFFDFKTAVHRLYFSAAALTTRRAGLVVEAYKELRLYSTLLKLSINL